MPNVKLLSHITFIFEYHKGKIIFLLKFAPAYCMYADILLDCF